MGTFIENIRTCTKCKISKDISFFGIHKKNKPGSSRRCKKCIGQAWKDWEKKGFNKDKYNREYKERNKVEISKRNWQYVLNDKSRHISKNMGCTFSAWVKAGGKGNTYVLKYVGLTNKQCVEYLKSLLKPGMRWDNYGKKGWEVDHIIPRSKFDHTKESEKSKCWNYKNIRPLWVIENSRKNAR